MDRIDRMKKKCGVRNERPKLIAIHHSSFCLHPFFFILSILSILFESALTSLAIKF
jgi:hypothetical protein